MILSLLARRSLKAKIALGTLVTFLAGTWSISFFTLSLLRDDLQQVLGARQFSTVSLLAAQVNDEMEYRLKALEATASYLAPAMSGDPRMLQTKLESYPGIQHLFNGTVLVTGTDGTAIADMPHLPGRVGTNYSDREVIAAALKEGRATIGQPVIGKVMRAPLLTIGAPIRDETGRVIGALLGAIDLSKPNFLDKIAENKYGETGSFHIVDRRFRLIVTSSDKSRIMETQPPLGVNPAVDRAIREDVVAVVYTNPRGVEVLGSAKGVPVANWYVGLIVPTDEVFAPVRAMQQRLLLGTLMFSLAASTLVWWLARRALNRHFAPVIETTRTIARLSGTSQPPRPLRVTSDDEVGELIGGFNRLLETLRQREEVLRQSEQRFQDIARASADWIWEVNANGRFTYASEGVEAVLGYQAAELIGKTPFDFMPDDEAERVRGVFKTIISNRDSFRDLDNINVHKDGRRLHIQTNGIPVFGDDGTLLGYRGLDRDITEQRQAENRIRDSELRYRRLADKSPLAIQQFSRDGTTISVNAAWERLWQVPLAALSEYNVLRDKQLERNGFLPLLQRAFAGETVEFPEHAYDKAQSPEVPGAPGQMWLRAFAYAVKDDDGNVLEVVVIQEDVTERRITEDALRQSECRSRAIIEASPVALAINDADGNITAINRSFVQTIGYRQEEIPTLADWWPLAYPDTVYRQWVAEQWQARMEEAKKTGTPFAPMEVNIRCKDASVRTFLASAAPLEESFAGSHLVVLYDITDRRSAEELVRKLSQAVEQSPESIVITNLSAEIEYVNEAFVQKTGFTRDEVLGRNPRILSSGKTPAETAKSLWDALTQGRPWDGEFHNRRKDGSEYLEHAVIAPIRQPDGTTSHYVAVKEDITKRRLLEDTLRQHKEELQELARSILEVREEERRKLARELHDDLGHRVTILSMDIGRLESKLLPAESAAKAMLPVILDQLYQFADATRRICEDLRPGMLDTLGLPAAIENHIDSFAARTGIPCELVMSHHDFEVDAKVGINLFRILQEALNNALKYAKASNILVTLDFSEHEISLIIEDNGVGFPEPGEGGRVGFGLLGMRERAAILNGQMSISSQPGRGVRLEVVIPT